MTVAGGQIPHLIFSTRQARPEGAGFNREIIAESPGLSSEARRQLASLADMTGFVLRKPKLPPLWAFRRLDAEQWLLVRAVSLGLYRKGNHQLLAHGLVLNRDHMNQLDGNPFLLSTPEAREAGFSFEETHPAGQTQLTPKRLDPDFAGTAASLNLERFRRWSQELPRDVPAQNVSFSALFEAILKREQAVAWVEGEVPTPRFLEWFMLHLHPCDRGELSFHSWYAYDSPRPFDLMGVARSDAEELKRHLRGEVEICDIEKPRSRDAVSTLGERVQRLRNRDPLRYVQVMEECYRTLLEPRWRPDFRGKKLPSLSIAQADLCLRHGLEEPLAESEQEELVRLLTRQGSELVHTMQELARCWEEGTSRFAAQWSRFRRLPSEIEPQELEMAIRVAQSPQYRWSLLALLPHTEPAPTSKELRASRQKIASHEDFLEILALFDDAERVALAEEVLLPWIEAEIQGEAVESKDPPIWALYLRFLHARGRLEEKHLLHFVQLLEKAPRQARLLGYRELQKVCYAIEQPAVALQLLFEREVPRLPEAARRIRVRDGVRRLLDLNVPVPGALGRTFEDSVSASAGLEALTEWVQAMGRPDAWHRGKGLMVSFPTPLPDAVLPAAANLLVVLTVAGEDVAEGVELLGRNPEEQTRLMIATARALIAQLWLQPATAPMFRGIAVLLDLRHQLPEIDQELDRALAHLMLPALVLAQPVAAGSSLRRNFKHWLDSLLVEQRFLKSIEEPANWRGLLWDELLIEYSRGDGIETEPWDPRLRAYQMLTWHHWSEAQDSPAVRRAEVGLLRRPAASWSLVDQGRLLETTLPESFQAAGRSLLKKLLPSMGAS